nr:hypothetical protein [uncultured Roseococcus sp.]
MESVTRPRAVAVATALARLQELAARAASPARMAREVQIILREWSAEESDLLAVSSRKTDFLSKLENGVADAEEQLADVDREDRAALLQAETTLAALTACREAAANEALPI